MTINWIYLDESEFELNEKSYIAYGALITENLISQDNIDRAMTSLKKYRDEKDEQYLPENDDRTIERGYFHACDDACCAHTSICWEIENLNGEISLNCVPKSDKANINFLSMTSAIPGFHQRGFSALIYEERPGLTNEVVNRLIQDYEIGVIQDYANCLYMPIQFSEPGFKISDKKEPGLQFIDFILWAYQRKLRGDDSWYNRMMKNTMKCGHIHILSQFAEDKGYDDYSLTATLNKGLTISDRPRFYDDENLNKKYFMKDNFEDINDKTIFDSLLLIDEIMSRVKYNNNPVRFFESQIKNSIENKRDNLENYLITFLKMFDTFGFINLAFDVDTKNRMLLARKIVALSFCYNYEGKFALQTKLQNTWNILKSFKFV